jgi:hypothetical protein
LVRGAGKHHWQKRTLSVLNLVFNEKKQYYEKAFIASCITISLAISSCSNFWMSHRPIWGTPIPPSKPADAKVIMNGLMSKMANVAYYGRNFPLYADAKGGDFTIASQGRGYDYLYVFNHSASSNPYSGIWTQGFHTLVQINNLLTNIDKLIAAGSTENFNTYKGQALTARALINFDLVRLYGKPYNMEKSALGIPNVTKVLEYSAQEKRISVEENYKQIVQDLKDAESLLPNPNRMDISIFSPIKHCKLVCISI